MKKTFAVLLSAVIAIGACSCTKKNAQDNQAKATTQASEQAQLSKTAESKSLDNPYVPDSRKNLSSGDVPDNTVAVIFTPTQPHIGGMYIPDDQDEWKKAITAATGHLKDKKFDVYPWSDMKPISFLWTHDGITDSWTLGNDGSFLGEHSTGSGDEQFKNNYIDPGDATDLAKLMIKAYELLEINPIVPDKISDVIRAELIVNDKSYVLEDQDGIKKLEEALKNGKRELGSGCSFELLRLYKKDCQTLDIAIATDGCAVWHSDGIYYKYGENGKAEAIFKLFGIDLPVIVPTD